MNKPLKEALSLILILTAISGHLCQPYPETSATKNEETAEEFATNVQTLSQIEEENAGQISGGDLKRQSRKVPCPFKLKSGLTKVASIPCGAAAGAAAAAAARKSIGTNLAATSVGGGIGTASVGGSIGATSVGEATLRSGLADMSGIEGGFHVGHLTDTFDVVNGKVLEIGSSLHGAISSLQDLLVQMPAVLGHLRSEVETVNAPVALRYDVARTCDSYAHTEKGISGIINYIYNSLKLPTCKGAQARINSNIEIGSCLDNIKSNMMNFLATIRSWFSCDKLSSLKGLSKFQSYINSIPSGSQCSILNGLAKSAGNCGYFPHTSGQVVYATGGSGGFSASGSSQINTAVIEQQLGEAKAVLRALEGFPSMMSSLMEDLKVQLANHVISVDEAQRAYVRTLEAPVAPIYQVPVYPQIRAGNVMSLRPSVSGQTQINFNQRTEIPAAKTTLYIAPPRPPPLPVLSTCSGQSIIDNVYSTVATSPVVQQSDSYFLSTSTGNINSGQSALNLLNVRVNLARETVYALLKGQVPAAGDIIILNLTDDIMLVGSPSDDFSPVTFNFIYRGISTRTRHNNNVLVWNLSEDDFSCNQNIFNDVLGHLVYGV